MFHYSVFFCSLGLESHSICILLMSEWQNAPGAPSFNCLALLRFGFFFFSFKACVQHLAPANWRCSASSWWEVGWGGVQGGAWQFAKQTMAGGGAPCNPGCMVLDASAARPPRPALVPSEFGYIGNRSCLPMSETPRRCWGHAQYSIIPWNI